MRILLILKHGDPCRSYPRGLEQKKGTFFRPAGSSSLSRPVELPKLLESDMALDGKVGQNHVDLGCSHRI
jgi:hypothetical protein